MKVVKTGSKSATRIAAIILTVVTFIILFWGLNALFRPVPVVVVNSNVPAGQLIEKGDLILDKVSSRDRHKEAFMSITDVTGTEINPAGLYAATDLFPGQQLIKQQTTDNPDKLRTALAGINRDQTVLQLNGTQAFWPDILRDGDFVMIQAIYPDISVTENIGVGRITKNLAPVDSASALAKVGQSSSNSQQNKQYVICSIQTEEKALQAIFNAKMVYLRPMHPQLGRRGL